MGELCHETRREWKNRGTNVKSNTSGSDGSCAPSEAAFPSSGPGRGRRSGRMSRAVYCGQAGIDLRTNYVGLKVRTVTSGCEAS